MHVAQRRCERERINGLDRQRGWASRSTTTWVSWMAKRSRAFSTTPRSSQCDRPSGCVEMISSSGRNVRIASSIAWIGSPSPISPSRLDARSAHRGEARVESLLRRRSRVVLVGDPVPERRVERRAHDEDTRASPAARSATSARSSGPPTVSFATTRIRCSSGACDAGTCFGGRSRSPRRNSQNPTPAVRTAKTANPSHLLIQRGDDDRREVADRQPDEPERRLFAPEGVRACVRAGRP